MFTESWLTLINLFNVLVFKQTLEKVKYKKSKNKIENKTTEERIIEKTEEKLKKW